MNVNVYGKSLSFTHVLSWNPSDQAEQRGNLPDWFRPFPVGPGYRQILWALSSTIVMLLSRHETFFLLFYFRLNFGLTSEAFTTPAKQVLPLLWSSTVTLHRQQFTCLGADDNREKSSSRSSNRNYSRTVRRNSSAAATKQVKNYNNYEQSSSEHRRFNREITQCQSSIELLQKLQYTKALTKLGAGGSFNSVNFSTLLHRLARFSTLNSTVRASILMDPRFALLLACLGEFFVLGKKKEGGNAPVRYPFSSRELSNIAWALAKLKIAPPTSVVEMVDENATIGLVTEVCQTIRVQLVEYATLRQKQRDDSSEERLPLPWVSSLSRLAGWLLDLIGHEVQHYLKDNNQADFKMQEFSNLLWSWATAARVRDPIFTYVMSQMISKQTLMLKNQKDPQSHFVLQPQEWSNAIWAAASAQVSSFELLEFVSVLLKLHPTLAEEFKPQELANTAWGVATIVYAAATAKGALVSDGAQPTYDAAALEILRRIAGSASRRADTFKTQELANTLWALATVSFGSSLKLERSLNTYVALESDDLKYDVSLMLKTKHAILEASLPKLSKFRSQELNNLAWSLARLVEPEEARGSQLTQQVLLGLGRELARRKRSATTQDIGTTLWSLATLEFPHKDIYRQIVGRLNSEEVRRAKPQELSNTLWSLATADIEVQNRDAFDTTMLPESLRLEILDPVANVFGMVADELMRRPFDFKPQEIKDVLWSFSRSSIRHPRLFQSTAVHLVGDADFVARFGQSEPRGFSGFSPQGLGNLAWAFARQAQLACEVTDRYPGTANRLQCNGKLAVHTAGFFDWGEFLLHRLFHAIANSALVDQENLSKLKPQDLSNMAWTFAVLGMSHTQFMETAKFELRRRASLFVQGETTAMNSFKGQELANSLWALATLNIPAGDLFEVLAPYFEMICKGHGGVISQDFIVKSFKRQELANIAWSCAVFGVFPTALMQLLYTGLFGTGKSTESGKLAELYGDCGLQSQAIMSLIYVQAAMDLEQMSCGLRLPPDFPNGWHQYSQLQDDVLGETMIELSLSTSKIQRAVAAALGRVGFQHVEEHILTMEELAGHGINLAPKSLEILSIDIANLEQKIGIEVDGPAHFVTAIDDVEETGGHTKLINGKLEYQFRWRGEHHRINGPTALKQRLLSKLGWDVIHLPFWEWYVLGGDTISEENYCRKILRGKSN